MDPVKRASAPEIEVQFMGPETVERKVAQFRNIYRDAFTTPPWDEPAVYAARFVRQLKEISKAPGFRCVAAFKETGGMVGFALGYPPQAHQDLLAQLVEALGTQQANHLLPDSFYLAELAVIGSHQRRGVGSRLHEALLRESGSEKALATVREDTPGFDFFMAHGWEVTASIAEFYHPGQEMAPWLPAVLITRMNPGD
ncbi:MAG: GNAT family N-acetyltransferase [Anaerolineales bacterium]|nr:GNAT family N-acetyltransferase [Anaerolineales bacterium]